MEQNTRACTECIKKIKDKLDVLGYATLQTGNDILCRTSLTSISSLSASAARNGAVYYSQTAKCPLHNKVDLSNGCPNSGHCSIPSVDCPLHGNGGNTEGNGNTDNNTGGGTTPSINAGSLKYLNSIFRIKPADTFMGIVLHVVILHGETCELKMSFGYDSDSAQQVIDVINFLIG